MKEVRTTRTLKISCDGCGVKGAEPVEPELAVAILHKRGWYLGETEDFCAGCTARRQAAGTLGPRPTVSEARTGVAE